MADKEANESNAGSVKRRNRDHITSTLQLNSDIAAGTVMV